MYQIGEKVMYGIHGVCRVSELELRSVDNKQVQYLVLEPVGQDGARYYVPTHNAVAMAKLRHVLSKDELHTLFTSEKVHEDCWITDENRRKQCYRELITGSDHFKLVQMVCTLYRKKYIQTATGKKLHMCDDNFLRDAEKLLTGEIAEAMGMEEPDSKLYLRNMLKEDA